MDKDFYNLNLDIRLVSLKKSNISEANKKLILDFVENCFVEGLGQQRILKYISTLNWLNFQYVSNAFY
jgi:hypothetical protein